MTQSHSTGIKKYVFSDFATAWVSWLMFFYIRKTYVENLHLSFTEYLQDFNFVIGGIIVGVYWLYIYALSGSYTNVYTKSRIQEITKTGLQSLLGNVFLGIVIILDDYVVSYKDYYFLILVLVTTHFAFTLIGRLVVLFRAKKQIKNGLVRFPTLLIGNHSRMEQIFHDLQKLELEQGIYISQILTNQKFSSHQDVAIHNYSLKTLEQQIDTSKFSQVILALSPEEREQSSTFISILDFLGLHIKMVPEMGDSLLTRMDINNPFGTALIEVETAVMQPWQKLTKRMIDVVLSCIALIFTSPLLLIIAILIKRESAGSVFYKQERIGRKQKPFTLYKLRSMHVNAEENGPQLSSETDQRTTAIGQFIRKYRIDEIPQFYNVIRGDMSIIGPRPERKFYADQIIQKNPEYRYLYKVKPGITSWGMVRFGYASTVEQMVERMKYDLLYIHNFSLLMDLRIFIYTIITVLKGKGV